MSVAEGPFCVWKNQTNNQLWHTKGNNCPVSQKKNNADRIVIVIMCVSSSQNFVMWLQGDAIAFFISPAFNKQKMSFPLSCANVTNSVLCDFCQRHQVSLLIQIGWCETCWENGRAKGGCQGKIDERSWRMFIKASCLHFTNSNHNHNNLNHNLQRALQAARVYICSDGATLQFGLIYFSLSLEGGCAKKIQVWKIKLADKIINSDIHYTCSHTCKWQDLFYNIKHKQKSHLHWFLSASSLWW